MLVSARRHVAFSMQPYAARLAVWRSQDDYPNLGNLTKDDVALDRSLSRDQRGEDAPPGAATICSHYTSQAHHPGNEDIINALFVVYHFCVDRILCRTRIIATPRYLGSRVSQEVQDKHTGLRVFYKDVRINSSILSIFMASSLLSLNLNFLWKPKR